MILYAHVTLDGKEKHVMNVLHYQDVPMGVVRDHPILVNVTKVGKAICVMNQFVCKFYFLTLKISMHR